MTVRLVNKVTGVERELPDRLAAYMLADKSTGWTKPKAVKANKSTTDADTSDSTGD